MHTPDDGHGVGASTIDPRSPIASVVWVGLWLESRPSLAFNPIPHRTGSSATHSHCCYHVGGLRRGD
jgi:hypothetical protein